MNVDVAYACERIVIDYFWFIRKYMRFLNATNKNIDVVISKYKKKEITEWLIISKV